MEVMKHITSHVLFCCLQSVNFLSWCNVRHLWFLGKIWKWNFKSFNLHLLICCCAYFLSWISKLLESLKHMGTKGPAYASRISNYWGKQGHSHLLIFPILPHSERPSSSGLKHLCQFESREGHSLKFHSLQWLGLMMGAGWRCCLGSLRKWLNYWWGSSWHSERMHSFIRALARQESACKADISRPRCCSPFMNCLIVPKSSMFFFFFFGYS